EDLGPAAPGAQRAIEKKIGRAADEAFGEVVGLDEEEPMVVIGGERLVGPRENLGGRDDVEEGRALDAVGMIETQAMKDARAAVVPHRLKPLETELAHQFGLIGGHGALAVAGMVFARGWLRAVAITAQVGTNHREVPRQRRRQLVPHGVGLGISMQQQKRRSPAARPELNLRAGCFYPGGRESLEHAISGRAHTDQWDIVSLFTARTVTTSGAFRQ